MSVSLRPMDEDDYRSSSRDAVGGYVDQLVDSGGWTPDEARRLGNGELRLNVFGHNDVARGLCRSLGYAEVAVELQKQLEV